MQRLLTDSTRAVLAERQRVVRQSAESTIPPSVTSGGAMVRRFVGSVGNPNQQGTQAGWTIVKGDTPSQMQSSGTTARTIGFEKNAVVMACVRLITNLVAAVPIEVYRKLTVQETQSQGGAGDVVLLPEHPAQKLFDTPYFSVSPHRFRQLIGVHWALYGNWFAALVREGATPGGDVQGTGLPMMMRLVHPERLMYVYLDAQTEEPILYDWRDRYGKRHRTLAMDMVHCADMTATDWIFGYPRAAAALLDIQTDNEASAYVRQVLHNDGTAGTVVMLESMISEDEARVLKERYYQRNVERGERGRTSFMSGVKDVKAIGFTLKDLEFPNLRQVSREDICAAFGVDPRMVGVGSATGSGDKGSLSGKQFLEARFRLIQESVIPQMRDFEATLNTWVMPEFGDVYCRFSRASLAELTEDETETWTRGTAAMAAGGITREEFRRTVGQPDKMDDTDTLYVPTLSQIMPVSEQFASHEASIANQNAKATALTQGANTGDAGNSGSGGDQKKLPSGKSDTTVRVIVSTPGDTSGGEVLQPLEQRKAALSTAVRQAAWDDKQAKAGKHEPRMQQAATLRFHLEREKVEKIVRAHAHGRALRAGIPDPNVNAALREIKELYRVPNGELTKAWEESFGPLIGEAVDTGGEDLSGAMGVDWDLRNPQVALAVKRRAKDLASSVGRTTADHITEAMSLAFDAGMSMSEMADLVASTAFGDSMTANRARTIARTESIGALNEGEYRAAKLSNVIATKEWLSQGDDRVRESHAEVDGEEVGLDETFSNGLMHPGDQDGDPEEVINCRCGVLYHGDSGDVDDDLADGDTE